MAITPTRVTVTNSATLIATNDRPVGDAEANKFSLLIKNVTATAAVFLGDSAETTSTGWQWDTTDGPVAVDLEAGESLYGIVASTNQTLHVLRQGR